MRWRYGRLAARAIVAVSIATSVVVAEPQVGGALVTLTAILKCLAPILDLLRKPRRDVTRKRADASESLIVVVVLSRRQVCQDD